VRLGVSCGFWGTGQEQDNLAVAARAEELGYSVVWVAEAYGFDAATVLAWIGARTSRIDLGAGVLQIPGRSAAMTAMTAASLDGLSGGRFRLGLGISGPQVSEGWHGVRFGKPLARTREYIEIVRTALARQPLRYEGEHYTLPLPDGPGKALRLNVAPSRHDVPIYLAAVGPRNLELAGEVADGWLGVFLSPEFAGEQLASLRTGLERSSDPRRPFEIDATVPVAVGDDLAAGADLIRPYAALYVGGMGSREQNFYNRLARRMGYEDAARRVQDLYLDRQWRDAAAAVPQQFIDDTSLIGPPERIAERLAGYAEAGLTTITVAPWGRDLAERVRCLEVVAEAAESAGVL
jgi:F420-dependent oxidoreductase-like protein